MSYDFFEQNEWQLIHSNVFIAENLQIIMCLNSLNNKKTLNICETLKTKTINLPLSFSIITDKYAIWSQKDNCALIKQQIKGAFEKISLKICVLDLNIINKLLDKVSEFFNNKDDKSQEVNYHNVLFMNPKSNPKGIPLSIYVLSKKSREFIISQIDIQLVNFLLNFS